MALVTKQDVQALTGLPNSVGWKEVERYWEEAEWHDIRPFLNECGEDFWLTFTSNISQQKYQDLLNGKVYTNKSGKSVEYKGIKPAIVKYGFARYVEQGQQFATRSGMRYKMGDDTEPVSGKQLERLASKEREDAFSYAQDVIEFLEDQDTYDWSSNGNSPRSGFEIQAVGGNPRKRPFTRRQLL